MSRGVEARRLGRLALALASAVAVLAASPADGQERGVMRRDSVRVGGYTRTYRVYVPQELERGPALILAFHGGGGDGAVFRGSLGGALEELADEHGFVLAYPDGYEGHWNDCRARAAFAAKRLDVDDMGFVRALVHRLRHEHEMDPGSVHALGFSNGGHLVYRLAIEAPELVRSVAAFGANLPVPDELDCRALERPVAVLIVNGTADPFAPYDGGDMRAPDGSARGRALSARATAEHFARLAGHDPAVATRELHAPADEDDLRVERAAWTEPGKAPVVLVTVHGGGHAIPGPRTRLPAFVGAVERRFDGPAAAIRFFLGLDWRVAEVSP